MLWRSRFCGFCTAFTAPTATATAHEFMAYIFTCTWYLLRIHPGWILQVDPSHIPRSRPPPKAVDEEGRQDSESDARPHSDAPVFQADAGFVKPHEKHENDKEHEDAKVSWFLIWV